MAAANAMLYGQSVVEATRIDADKKSKELYGDYNRLQDRINKIQPGFVSYVRNMPVLDLANPSLKVNQIMPTNLQDDVIFSASPPCRFMIQS